MCYSITSVFVEQNKTHSEFSNADSWVILSEIEQSIKRKIEAIGTPLKDWDIQINYGIKTGLNDAFIITTEKRNEILSNCRSDEERSRTEEIIRPILRGRDIKRYSHDWANLWLINSHNGVKGRIPRINIDEYPAVKAHLDQYWTKIKNRADKGDTPYNLRNCAYLEDFQKPKIIFQEIVQESQFVIDDKVHFYCNDTCRIITGQDLFFLVRILNSKLFFYSVKTFYGGGKLGESGVRMKHTFFNQFPCIQPNAKVLSASNDLLIDECIYELYGLTPEEINYIDNQ